MDDVFKELDEMEKRGEITSGFFGNKYRIRDDGGVDTSEFTSYEVQLEEPKVKTAEILSEETSGRFHCGVFDNYYDFAKNQRIKKINKHTSLINCLEDIKNGFPVVTYGAGKGINKIDFCIEIVESFNKINHNLIGLNRRNEDLSPSLKYIKRLLENPEEYEKADIERKVDKKIYFESIIEETIKIINDSMVHEDFTLRKCLKDYLLASPLIEKIYHFIRT